ncbi:MAG: hypothetical protein JWO52_5243 [Gammaproteobacteria bacterium]|nr:hypothetical protein [Gammaproteobacteria bacterium]
MRVTPGKLSSGLLLALLATCLFLAASAAAWAQTAKRSFQMALWPDTSPSVVPTPSDADIKTFWELYGQPAAPARSVVFLQTWQTNSPLPAFDWSRILAVEIDEPYGNELIGHFGPNSVQTNPCYDGPSSQRMQVVTNTMDTVKAEAKMVHSLSPRTRVWVNFTTYEAAWMQDTNCPLALNQSYIDVISVDDYRTPFRPNGRPNGSPNVQSYYAWFINNPATLYQQLALVPGTFYQSGVDDPQTQANYLQGYFDYANSKNQNCNLSLGSAGRTWNFDGCRVWIVMGWLAGNYTDPNGNLYVGELDPSSGPITTAWRQEARPTRAQILQNVVLPVVLGN